MIDRGGHGRPAPSAAAPSHPALHRGFSVKQYLCVAAVLAATVACQKAPAASSTDKSTAKGASPAAGAAPAAPAPVAGTPAAAPAATPAQAGACAVARGRGAGERRRDYEERHGAGGEGPRGAQRRTRGSPERRDENLPRAARRPHHPSSAQPRGETTADGRGRWRARGGDEAAARPVPRREALRAGAAVGAPHRGAAPRADTRQPRRLEAARA